MELIIKMLKKITKLFKTKEFVVIAFILLFIVLLSYGKTLGMFFG